MPEYRIETHAHTDLVSPCGRLSPAELVSGYLDAGYSGLIVTDHFVQSLPVFAGVSSWRDRVHAYFAGYRAVRDAARGTGLAVYPGLELSFARVPNDFLVYGLDEEALVEMPEPFLMEPSQFRRLAAAAGALVFQAHPFRGVGPAAPRLLDGVEVYNGNRRHDSRTRLAADFAERHALLAISGSDTHLAEDIGSGGVVFPELPASIHEFTELYRRAPSEIALLVPDPIH